MRNQCTVCGKRLELWERVWGRFDHASCRSTGQERQQIPSSLFGDGPMPRVSRRPEEGLEFSSAPHQLFTRSKEPTLWQRSA